MIFLSFAYFWSFNHLINYFLHLRGDIASRKALMQKLFFFYIFGFFLNIEVFLSLGVKLPTQGIGRFLCLGLCNFYLLLVQVCSVEQSFERGQKKRRPTKSTELTHINSHGLRQDAQGLHGPLSCNEKWTHAPPIT